MTQMKISQLPAAPYKALASEAERRGFSLTKGLITNATAVILIGALDIIRELSERVETIEAVSGLTKRAVQETHDTPTHLDTISETARKPK